MFFDQLNEVIKQVPAVMWTRCAFRVILHGKCRLAFYLDAFDRIVVQIKVGDLNVFCFFYSFGIDTETMILCGDFTFAG